MSHHEQRGRRTAANVRVPEKPTTPPSPPPAPIRDERIESITVDKLVLGWPKPKPTDVAIVIAGPDRERLVEIQWNGVVRYDPDANLDEASRRFWRAIGHRAPYRAEQSVEAGTPDDAARAACSHCEDGHQDPRRVPWGVRVGAERDHDGQPTHLRVERTQGSHVAQSDADWLWELIRRCR